MNVERDYGAYVTGTRIENEMKNLNIRISMN